MMVGVGEATLGPAALSLLSDYFPPRVRATVQAIYSSGIAIGAGLAFFFGGWLGQYYGWRVAFYALGFPGLVTGSAVATTPLNMRYSMLLCPLAAWLRPSVSGAVTVQQNTHN